MENIDLDKIYTSIENNNNECNKSGFISLILQGFPQNYHLDTTIVDKIYSKLNISLFEKYNSEKIINYFNYVKNLFVVSLNNNVIAGRCSFDNESECLHTQIDDFVICYMCDKGLHLTDNFIECQGDDKCSNYFICEQCIYEYDLIKILLIKAGYVIDKWYRDNFTTNIGSIYDWIPIVSIASEILLLCVNKDNINYNKLCIMIGYCGDYSGDIILDIVDENIDIFLDKIEKKTVDYLKEYNDDNDDDNNIPLYKYLQEKHKKLSF